MRERGGGLATAARFPAPVQVGLVRRSSAAITRPAPSLMISLSMARSERGLGERPNALLTRALVTRHKRAACTGNGRVNCHSPVTNLAAARARTFGGAPYSSFRRFLPDALTGVEPGTIEPCIRFTPF